MIHYRWEYNEQYSEQTDEVMCDTIEYDYEPKIEELDNAIYEIFAKVYQIPLKVAENIVRDYDLYEACEEMFEDELREYFSKAAYEEYFGE